MPTKEIHYVDVKNGTKSYYQEVEMIRCDEQFAIFEAGKGDIHRVYLLKKIRKISRSRPVEGDVFFVYGKIDYLVNADDPTQSQKAEKLLTRLRESSRRQSVKNIPNIQPP